MKNLSRRKVLIGAIAAPYSLQASLPAIAAIPLAEGADKLLAKIAMWSASDGRLTSLELQWQGLESLLFDKAKRMRMSCDKATRSNMPEAQGMRALDVEINATHAKLEALASDISLMPALTIADAIAKIELGLKVQGPYDWREHALELLEGGIAELQTIIRDTSAVEFSSFR